MSQQHSLDKEKRTVLIVGAGPTGLTLACELLRRGIPCRLIDKREKASTHSKALGVSATSLMIFERLGIANALVKDGIPMQDTYFYWKGKRLLHTNYRYLKNTCFPFMLLAHQTKTEQHLARALKKLGGKIEHGVELLDLKQSNDHVTVVLKHKAEKRELAHYEEVIGCDGSKSMVREKIGVDFFGKDYGLHFIYGDFELEGLQGDPTIAHYYLDGCNLLILIPSPNGVYRIVGLIPGDKDKRPKPNQEELQAYLDRFGPGGIKLKKPTQFGSVPIYYRITDEVQVGRVFLAGDAFHLFSPIGGQGMNSGIQDAYNLAWKLAYVKKGSAKRSLLDTYREERLPLVNEVIQNVVGSVHLITRHDKENDPIAHAIAPLMRNREDFRNKLPKNYSGFNYQYAASDFIKNDFKNKENSSLGKAGQYSNNFEALHCLTDFMLLISEKDNQSNYQVIVNDYPFIKIVLDKKLGSGQFTLIRPDGFISYQADTGDLKTFKRYLESFYEKEMINVT